MPRRERSFPPISLATTFAEDAVGKHRGYEYSRSGEPHPRRRSRPVSRRWRTRATGSRSRAVSPPRMPCCARSIPATTSSSRRRVRRHVPPGRPRARATRHRVDGRRPARSGCARRGLAPRDSPGVDRVADQPGAVDRRHRAGGGLRARARRAVAVDNTFATPYLQHRSRWAPMCRCTPHEVPGWPLRCRGRLRGDRRRRARRRGPVPAERDGRSAVSVRLLSRASRSSRRSRSGWSVTASTPRRSSRRCSRSTMRSRGCSTRAVRPPGPRRRSPADA